MPGCIVASSDSILFHSNVRSISVAWLGWTLTVVVVKAVVATAAYKRPRLAVDKLILVHLPATHFIV